MYIKLEAFSKSRKLVKVFFLNPCARHAISFKNCHKVKISWNKGLLTFFLLFLMMTNTYASQGDDVKIVFDVNTKLYIGGESALNRMKYFNIHGNPNSIPDKYRNYFFNELKVNFGRGFTLMHGLKGLKEDPKRPGFMDEKAFKIWAETANKEYFKRKHSRNPALNDFVHCAKPSLYFSTHGSFRFKDHNAATEYIVNMFKYYKLCSSGRWFEIANEPFIHARDMGTNNQNIIELHKKVAMAMHKNHPDIMVGGPGHTWPVYERKDFKIWNRGMGLFMEMAAKEMDFYSLHLYCVYFDDKAWIRSGANTDAILDLVEAQSKLLTGQVKPFLISEYGSAYKKGAKIREDYFPQRDWFTIRGVNSKLFTFLNRPDRIAKTIPFIVVKAEWYKEKHPYPWALFHRKNKQWRMTHLDKLYKFWKDVDGYRVLCRSGDPDIQVVTFLNKKKVYLCLNNLEEQETKLQIKDFNDDASDYKNISITRLYSNGKEPLLTHASMTEFPNQITLVGDESTIISFELNEKPDIKMEVNERRYYAHKVVVPIDTKGNTFKVLCPEAGKAEYARLSIGFGRKKSLSRNPFVTFNTRKIHLSRDEKGRSPNYKSKKYASIIPQRSKRPILKDFFITKEVYIPVNWMQKENRIVIKFPDKGGYISSVILTAGVKE
jgi:porphyranase-like protein